MLSWFVDSQVINPVITRKRVVEKADVEIRPEKISSSCLDENVCINSIQKYFSADAWTAVEQVLEVVKKILLGFVDRVQRKLMTIQKIQSSVIHVCRGSISIVWASKSHPRLRNGFVANVM